MHSASKYIGGHSDTVAGVVAGRTDLIAHIRRTVCPYIGAKLAPFDAWLLLRGLRTLVARSLAISGRRCDHVRDWSGHLYDDAAIWWVIHIYQAEPARERAATPMPRSARRMPALMRDSTRKIAFRVPAYRRSRCPLGGN